MNLRTVAVLVTLAGLLAASPLSAGALPNQCVTDSSLADGVSQVCHTIDLTNAHNGAPVLNELAYFDVFYVWIGPGHCGNPVAEACAGQPSPSDGIPLPDGSGTVPTPGVFSILYQETNGAPGLQRLKAPSGGHLFWADRTVLV